MKWLHHLLKGASLSTALFVFQACYGVPQPLYDEDGMAPMHFSCISSETGAPLEGIQVRGKEWKDGDYRLLGVTDAEGKCKVEIPYLRNRPGPYLHFEDAAGHHIAKDTTLADLRDRDIVIKMIPAGQ